MEISWVIADDFDNHALDSKVLSNIGSTWGSYRTWRAWNTDNVICYDKTKSKDLVTRAFQAVCNLYIPQSVYADAGRPAGVKLFDGEFPAEFDHIEEIIAMHLIAENNDIVLLLGYDLTDSETEDSYEKHKRKNYLAAFTAAVKMYNNTQWVVLDHRNSLADSIENLENLTCDTFENVLELLSN